MSKMKTETTLGYANDKKSDNYTVYKEDYESEKYKGYIQKYTKNDIQSSKSLEKLLANS